jgi:VWFA-related protein
MQECGRRLVLCLLAGCVGLAAWQAPEPDASEVNSREVPATFTARANLVMVPVVVRDRQGHCVGNLGREDFQLLDRGKPQLVSSFSVERRDRRAATPTGPTPLQAEAVERAAAAPDRFLAYIFDDLNSDIGDFLQIRQAALRHLKTQLQPGDRAAILSSSGRIALEFTDDRAALEKALLRIVPTQRAPAPKCPELSPFQADWVENREPEQGRLLDALILETIRCAGLPNTEHSREVARSLIHATARGVIADNDLQVESWFDSLQAMVRRLSFMPGQRTIVLASPGFVLFPGERSNLTAILERAVRSNITVNAIDARALSSSAIVPMADRRITVPLEILRVKNDFERMAAIAQSDVLASLAEGTGGRLVENTNDLDGAFRRLAAAPEYVYLLGFTPQDLRSDGQFHALKVRVRNEKNLSVQTRRGYYAATRPAGSAEAANQEIEEAVFSRSEIRDLPVVLHTQFFKTGETTARLTVVARLAVQDLPLRQDQGRNRNDLTVVSALFDRNGNWVAGTRKIVELRLRDETLARKPPAEITVKTSFDVPPGSYTVRLVAHDAEAKRMAAENGSVLIP